MLQANARGNYQFLPGGEPYSSGVVAGAGYEIVHVTLRRPAPWREGFNRIEAELRDAGCTRHSLCGVELRSPAPYNRAGFLEFNRGYRALLEEWDLLVDGQNPVARTNVAPVWAAPSEPCLYGFSYTVPAARDTARTFVVAGAGELRGGSIEAAAVIRPGETSPDAMREKAGYVMQAMSRRLEALGVGWDQVTVTEIYTAQALEPLLGPVIMERIGASALHGVRWHPARPPIDELEFEMDVRGVRVELFI